MAAFRYSLKLNDGGGIYTSLTAETLQKAIAELKLKYDDRLACVSEIERQEHVGILSRRANFSHASKLS